MKKKIKILTERFTADGQKIDLKGIEIKDKSFKLKKDFLHEETFDTVIPFIEGNEMFIELDVKEEHLGLYPSVAIRANTVDIKNDDGYFKIIKKCELVMISLCSGPNVDKTIQSLREQIKENNG